MDTAMDMVIIDPPASVLAERQRLGLDHRDEVWDGEYHMVPNPMDEHQRMEIELAFVLLPIVRAAGLDIRCESNLIPAHEPGWHDYRVPDLVVFPPQERGLRGVIGPASLVTEIRSPRDESFEKLAFYEQLGVGEVLIIDRDTKAIRRWVLTGTQLTETAAGPDGRHHLACIPVALHTDHDVLVVTTPDGTTRI